MSWIISVHQKFLSFELFAPIQLLGSKIGPEGQLKFSESFQSRGDCVWECCGHFMLKTLYLKQTLIKFEWDLMNGRNSKYPSTLQIHTEGPSDCTCCLFKSFSNFFVRFETSLLWCLWKLFELVWSMSRATKIQITTVISVNLGNNLKLHSNL